MRMSKYFTSTISARGRQYFKNGKVTILEEKGGHYEARVRGSRGYRVSLDIEGGEPVHMACTCPYASDGAHCKHMAAVLYALDSKREKKEAQEDAPARMRIVHKNRTVFPFAEVEGQEEDQYSYFNMAHMTSRLEFTEEQCQKARLLIQKKQIELGEVNLGYSRSIMDSQEIIGSAQGVIKTRGTETHVSVTFDKDQIREMSCGVYSCFQSYSYQWEYGGNKPCVHTTALLFLLDDYLKLYNPGDATDRSAASLLNAYQTRHAKTVMADISDDQEELQLVPRLEKTGDGLQLSFRVGLKKLFVIKNLTAFIRAYRCGDTMQFGSATEIDFSKHFIEEKSKKYYSFIESFVLEEQWRAYQTASISAHYGFAQFEIKGYIALYGKALDEFFELCKGETLEYTDKTGAGRKKQQVRLRDAMPSFHLTIQKNIDEKGTFQGILVNGTASELIEGMKYVYHFSEDYINRTPEEELQDVITLFDMDAYGRISFQVGRKRMSEFYYTLLPILKRYGTVIQEDGELIGQYLPPEAAFSFYLDAENNNVTCSVKVAYGEHICSGMDIMRPEHVWEPYRDSNKEAEILMHIRRFFPEQDPDADLFHCGGDENAVYEVMTRGVDCMLGLGEVHSTDRFRRINARRKPQVTVGVSVESDLMNLDILSKDIPLEELLEALGSYRKKKKYHRLRNGDFLDIQDNSMELLAELMETLRMTPREFVKGNMQVPAYRTLYLDKMLEECGSVNFQRDRRFRALVKEFKTVNESDYEVPDSLRETMRGYQVAGYKWLRTLEACGFGGILADDMGLGKTLQIISALLARKEEGRQGTTLIVTPASLVYNWQEELRRFAPELQVCMVTGTQKERTEKIRRYQEADVCITSYDLLKRDIAEYEDCSFACQVLDEAQYIKNHSTAAAKAVKVVRSRIRYALTGTPIENRLSELWSIFDYLMPGFLYGYDVFKKEIETPIVKNQDQDAMERLKKMVSPFILRRLKMEVLKDLPDKLEEVRYARLENQQKKLYDGQVVHMREMLDGQSEEDFNKSKLQILAELTRIRQICCDPSLLWEDYDGGSAKREACMDLIRSAIEGEHKILVFSQFTTMLELLEADLTAAGLSYYKITGATPKEQRLSLVKLFNEDQVPVFLISLKAGGTGLNLVGADVVIHYDPWWNLAVQNQATDRAHRIGQTRVVSVYKLIVKDTIEEKILHMQEQKKSLADEVLSGELGGISSLSKEELLELVQ